MTARRRHRPARRRFHALQLDLVFFLAVVAMLLLHVSRKTGAGESAYAPHGAPVAFALSPVPLEEDPVFAPDSVARGGGAAEPSLPGSVLPDDLALAPPPPPRLPPVRAAKAAPPPIPRSVSRPSFAPAPPLFAEPPPPVGPAPGVKTGGAAAEAFVFRGDGSPYPVVFVDAPSLPLSEIPGVELRAIAAEAGDRSTNRVLRLSIPPEP